MTGTSETQWVVGFNGPRDAYQVPLALAEAGCLEALVTDWYWPLDRALVARLTRATPESVRRRLRARHVAGLPSRRVRSSLIEAVAQRVDPRSQAWVDRHIGRRTGRLARSRGAGLFTYSYYAHAAFEAYGDGPVPKLLFQVHPHAGWLHDFFTDEMTRVPRAAGSLRREHEMAVSPALLARLSAESAVADVCVVASTFGKRTLVERGIDEGRVHVVPYGVDLERFVPHASPPDGPFRALFVGQMVQRKGLSYLLDAWRQVGLPDAELLIAGRGAIDREQLSVLPAGVRVESHVSPARLRELYQTSDVFCMPSLAEGFGHVYLEALACGTPVIGTPNTAAPDIVREGREGFVVPIRDAGALADRLAWCHGHRDRLRLMRAEARARAEGFTWPNFRRRIADVARQVAA